MRNFRVHGAAYPGLPRIGSLAPPRRGPCRAYANGAAACDAAAPQDLRVPFRAYAPWSQAIGFFFAMPRGEAGFTFRVDFFATDLPFAFAVILRAMTSSVSSPPGSP